MVKFSTSLTQNEFFTLFSIILCFLGNLSKQFQTVSICIMNTFNFEICMSNNYDKKHNTIERMSRDILIFRIEKFIGFI